MLESQLALLAIVSPPEPSQALAKHLFERVRALADTLTLVCFAIMTAVCERRLNLISCQVQLRPISARDVDRLGSVPVPPQGRVHCSVARR